jgi:hypothetical protein
LWCPCSSSITEKIVKNGDPDGVADDVEVYDAVGVTLEEKEAEPVCVGVPMFEPV